MVVMKCWDTVNVQFDIQGQVLRMIDVSNKVLTFSVLRYEIFFSKQWVLRFSEYDDIYTKADFAMSRTKAEIVDEFIFGSSTRCIIYSCPRYIKCADHFKINKFLFFVCMAAD